MEKFEREPSIGDKTDEEAFQAYMEDLRLTPEDFSKKILDIGAGSAQFAKWAKEHGVSSQIYSLEPTQSLAEKEKGVKGLAEKIPFAEESFDLVVSVAAIPNVYLGEAGPGVKEKVLESLSEMVRVLKNGGEIRLARVLIGNIYEPQRILSHGTAEALIELKEKYGVQVEKIRTPSDDTYEYEGHERKNLLAEAYLLIIRKPTSRGVVNK